MFVSTARAACVRQVTAQIAVPVFVIPSSDEESESWKFSDDVIDVLAPLVDEPGFIGFKTDATAEVMNLMTGPNRHFLYDNVTRDGVAEIGVFGQVQGPFTEWDRTVYVKSEASGLLEPVFVIPDRAAIWVCTYIKEVNCGSLMSMFHTLDPDRPRED